MAKQRGQSSSAWICIYAYSYGLWDDMGTLQLQLVTILHAAPHGGTSFVAHILGAAAIMRHCFHYWPNGAPSAPGELNTYIPVQYTSSYGLLGCVYVWPGNFRNVLGLFFAFVLFAGFVVSQGLDSGLAPLSSVPFYASPRTFAAGRRWQAFTFGICMSCMNFCNAHPKWAPPPSPLANSESPALSLYICRDLSVI